MSKDEIIAMATEAGLNSYRIAPGEALAVWKRFAALAAAKEREECAQVCDELAELNRTAPTDSMWQWGECAAAIRTRRDRRDPISDFDDNPDTEAT